MKEQSKGRRSSLGILHTIYANNVKVKTIGTPPLKQLGIHYNSQADLQQLQYILGSILTYPSTELARLHKHANHLGSRDLHAKDQNSFTAQQQKQLNIESDHCPCCGFIKQHEKIKLFTSLDGLNNIGISTYLYFQTLIHLIVLLLIITIVYSIYTIATNVIASEKYQAIDDLKKLQSNVSILTISTGSKMLNPTEENQVFYLIQCIIGVLLVVVFGVGFVFIKGRERVAEETLDRDTDSAADYSIQVAGVPTGMTFEQMQEQVNNYEQRLHNIPTYLMIPGFKMAKYNEAKPFYLKPDSFDDEHIQKLNTQYDEMITVFTEWIEERRDQESSEFRVNKEDRKKQYDRFRELKKERLKAYEKKVEEVLAEFQTKEKQPMTTAFITFKSSYAKEVFVWQNQSDIISRIRYILTCCQEENKFYLQIDGQRKDVSVKAAPEPQDIKWQSIGYSSCQIVKRKFITNLTTLILLGISFGIVYGLSSVQKDNQDNTYVSIAISFIISIINMIIMQVIRLLTLYEKDYTETYHQTSLATKAVFALLTNSIAVPILVNYLLEDGNIFGVEGLAEDIFMLGITNSLLQPVLKIFDGYYYYTRVLAWWKNRPSSKMLLNQPQLNMYNEYIEFQTGFEYIYMVNLFLFVCFFTSLQPIMPVFGILGMTLMFWAQKYSIFQRCKRPVPGTTTVNSAMYVLIYLGPMFFCLGDLAWPTFFENDGGHENGDEFSRTLIPNIIGLVLALVIFLLPFELILYCAFTTQQQIQYKYDDNRIYLPSEYDRLNPSTSEQAVKEYLDYVESYRKELQNKSDEQKNTFQLQMLRQMQRGRQYRQHGFNIGTHNPLGLLLLPQPQNQMNQLVMSQLLMPSKQNIFPMLVPNWGGAHQHPRMGETHENLNNAPEINLFPMIEEKEELPPKYNPFEQMFQHPNQYQSPLPMFQPNQPFMPLNNAQQPSSQPFNTNPYYLPKQQP